MFLFDEVNRKVYQWGLTQRASWGVVAVEGPFLHGTSLAVPCLDTLLVAGVNEGGSLEVWSVTSRGNGVWQMKGCAAYTPYGTPLLRCVGGRAVICFGHNSVVEVGESYGGTDGKGFSCVRWNDVLVMYGGEVAPKKVVNTVTTFSFEDSGEQYTGGDVPERRMHHSACMVGSKMIVHGGESASSTLLSDMHELEMHSLTWRRVQHSFAGVGGISRHTIAFLASPRRILLQRAGTGNVNKLFSLFSNSEKKKKKKLQPRTPRPPQKRAVEVDVKDVVDGKRWTVATSKSTVGRVFSTPPAGVEPVQSVVTSEEDISCMLTRLSSARRPRPNTSRTEESYRAMYAGEPPKALSREELQEHLNRVLYEPQQLQGVKKQMLREKWVEQFPGLVLKASKIQSITSALLPTFYHQPQVFEDPPKPLTDSDKRLVRHLYKVDPENRALLQEDCVERCYYFWPDKNVVKPSTAKPRRSRKKLTPSP